MRRGGRWDERRRGQPISESGAPASLTSRAPSGPHSTAPSGGRGSPSSACNSVPASASAGARAFPSAPGRDPQSSGVSVRIRVIPFRSGIICQHSGIFVHYRELPLSLDGLYSPALTPRAFERQGACAVRPHLRWGEGPASCGRPLGDGAPPLFPRALLCRGMLPAASDLFY